MLRSKALKSGNRWEREKEPTTRLGKAWKAVKDKYKEYVYWPVTSYYHRYTERIGRSYAFATFGWLNYDFDSGLMWPLLEFKFKRIKKALIEGVAIQEDEHMAALDEAIKICGRLANEEYDYKYHRAHDKKWGKMRSKFIPNYDADGVHRTSTWETSRGKAKTAAQKRKERKEFLKCFDLGEADRAADLERFFEIIRKYQRTWWD